MTAQPRGQSLFPSAALFPSQPLVQVAVPPLHQPVGEEHQGGSVPEGGGVVVPVGGLVHAEHQVGPDRKSTRLNSSHANISYAVFCLKKKQNLGGLCRVSARR